MKAVKVNVEYVKAKRKENKQKNVIYKELYNNINNYCIEVTGKDEEHILMDEIVKMFPNVEIINLTIKYASSCLDGLNDKERYYIKNIIRSLECLKKVYMDQVPF